MDALVSTSRRSISVAEQASDFEDKLRLDKLLKGFVTTAYTPFSEVYVTNTDIDLFARGVLPDTDPSRRSELAQVPGPLNLSYNELQPYSINMEWEGLDVHVETTPMRYSDFRYLREQGSLPSYITGNVIVESADQELLYLDRRNSDVLYGGLDSTFGGGSKPGENPLVTAKREGAEEFLGVDAYDPDIEHTADAHMHSFEPIALLREDTTGSNQFLYKARLSGASDPLVVDGPEGGVLPLQKHPDFLKGYLFGNCNGMVPIGFAGVALYGRQEFGSGWFNDLLDRVEGIYKSPISSLDV